MLNAYKREQKGYTLALACRLFKRFQKGGRVVSRGQRVWNLICFIIIVTYSIILLYFYLRKERGIVRERSRER
jgi:hypothetical protein